MTNPYQPPLVHPASAALRSPTLWMVLAWGAFSGSRLAFRLAESVGGGTVRPPEPIGDPALVHPITLAAFVLLSLLLDVKRLTLVGGSIMILAQISLFVPAVHPFASAGALVGSTVATLGVLTLALRREAGDHASTARSLALMIVASNLASLLVTSVFSSRWMSHSADSSALAVDAHLTVTQGISVAVALALAVVGGGAVAAWSSRDRVVSPELGVPPRPAPSLWRRVGIGALVLLVLAFDVYAPRVFNERHIPWPGIATTVVMGFVVPLAVLGLVYFVLAARWPRLTRFVIPAAGVALSAAVLVLALIPLPQMAAAAEALDSTAEVLLWPTLTATLAGLVPSRAHGVIAALTSQNSVAAHLASLVHRGLRGGG